MRYFIRVCKYYIHTLIILSIVLGLMVAFKFVEADINQIFKDGWESFAKIMGIFFLIAIIYPRFGYTKRIVTVEPNIGDVDEKLEKFMETRGYELAKKEGNVSVYRASSIIRRIWRLGEEKVTVLRGLAGFELEGPTREVVPLSMNLNKVFIEE